MASEKIKYTMNVQLAGNVFVDEGREDKVAEVLTVGVADPQRIISEVMALRPGLERETVEAVFSLTNRAVRRLLLSGYRVNTPLYSAVARSLGVVRGDRWDPERNSLYACFTQSAGLRAAMGEARVNVVGRKGSPMYIGAVRSLGSPVHTLMVFGRKIKLEGGNPDVGITLISTGSGRARPVPRGMVACNQPSKLIFLLPEGLPDGEYVLRIVTQYSGSGGILLKTPRTAEWPVAINRKENAAAEAPARE